MPHKDPQARREYVRLYTKRRKAEDPDFVERRRAAVRKYDAAHREERRDKQRIRRLDPEVQERELAYNRNYREVNADTLREKGRLFNQTPHGKILRKKYRQSHPEVIHKSLKKWAKNNPEKMRAHWAVKAATRASKLVQKPCEVCGNPKSEAHHEEYSRPLHVIWLCRQHHVEADQRRREAEAHNHKFSPHEKGI